MMKARIDVAQREAFFLPSDGEPDRAAFPDLVGWYEIYAGWDVFANDTECNVAVFADRYWVLPPELPGARDLYIAWATAAEAKGITYRAEMEVLPWSWRYRLFHLMPIHEPRAIVLPLPLPELGRIRQGGVVL